MTLKVHVDIPHRACWIPQHTLSGIRAVNARPHVLGYGGCHSLLLEHHQRVLLGCLRRAPRKTPDFDPLILGVENLEKSRIFRPLRCKVVGEWGGAPPTNLILLRNQRAAVRSRAATAHDVLGGPNPAPTHPSPTQAPPTPIVEGSRDP